MQSNAGVGHGGLPLVYRGPQGDARISRQKGPLRLCSCCQFTEIDVGQCIHLERQLESLRIAWRTWSANWSANLSDIIVEHLSMRGVISLLLHLTMPPSISYSACYSCSLS